MTKSILLDKYPINSLEIAKNATDLTDVDQFIEYFKNKIEQHPIAAFISTFDHYAHTSSINGVINEDIISAKAIVFCFGAKLPNSKMLAVRPRSFSITEFKNSFVIDFMDAPNEEFQITMEEWSKEIIK